MDDCWGNPECCEYGGGGGSGDEGSNGGSAACSRVIGVNVGECYINIHQSGKDWKSLTSDISNSTKPSRRSKSKSLTCLDIYS